jgi:hypothetical protein
MHNETRSLQAVGHVVIHHSTTHYCTVDNSDVLASKPFLLVERLLCSYDYMPDDARWPFLTVTRQHGSVTFTNRVNESVLSADVIIF